MNPVVPPILHAVTNIQITPDIGTLETLGNKKQPIQELHISTLGRVQEHTDITYRGNRHLVIGERTPDTGIQEHYRGTLYTQTLIGEHIQELTILGTGKQIP
jgi:hypothetical protein